MPTEKLKSRFPRTLANLQAAIRELTHVLVYDDTDLRRPFRRIAMFHTGRLVYRAKLVPDWLKPLVG